MPSYYFLNRFRTLGNDSAEPESVRPDKPTMFPAVCRNLDYFVILRTLA
jgi:hypothetical protein